MINPIAAHKLQKLVQPLQNARLAKMIAETDVVATRLRYNAVVQNIDSTVTDADFNALYVEYTDAKRKVSAASDNLAQLESEYRYTEFIAGIRQQDLDAYNHNNPTATCYIPF